MASLRAVARAAARHLPAAAAAGGGRAPPAPHRAAPPLAAAAAAAATFRDRPSGLSSAAASRSWLSSTPAAAADAAGGGSGGRGGAAVAGAVGDDAPRAAGLRTSIDAITARLMDAQWANTEEDVDELLVVVEDGEALLDDYRGLYASEGGAATPATYAAFESFYRTAQALELTLAFEGTVTLVMREHMDMTGALGNTTAVPEAKSDRLNRVLTDYVAFVRAVAEAPTDPLRAKVESQLGPKVLQLRAVPSVGDAAVRRNVPVAGDRIVTDRLAVTTIDVSARRAAKRGGAS